MDYTKHYNLLIERARGRTLEGYKESHHIVPRCMGGSDDPSNLADLTPEEHYLAHLLLMKMHPHNPKLYAAALIMTSRPGNKAYGWLKRKQAELMSSDYNPMRRFPEKNHFRYNKYWVGRNHSDEAKRKCSEAKLGEKNPNYKKPAWENVNATAKSIAMWSRAQEYFDWWKKSGLAHGQNPMARAFDEKYTSTHGSLVKRFREGWIPNQDPQWRARFVELP